LAGLFRFTDAKQMLKRPAQHVIDTRAKKVLEGLLPHEWNFNEMAHDYGKDYLVEPADDSYLTGTTFFVQLKGTTRIKTVQDQTSISFPLKKKHAAYYLDQVKESPVFLVVVDVDRKRAWWIFIQEYLASDTKWRRLKQATIHLPLSNDLASIGPFKAEVQRAKEWLRKQSAYTLKDALAIERERIRAKDPRCDVDISVIDGVTHYMMKANEPINIRMTMTGTEFINDFTQGELVSFAPGQLTIEGSGVLSDFNEKGGQIQVAKKTPAELMFVLKDASGAEFSSAFTDFCETGLR